MSSFYKAFEDRYRGSRSLIKSRLEVYLSFIEPLKTLYDDPEVLDLGCGRGEWLELMQGNGFKAKGVDLDEGMMLVCQELNLDVYLGDAVDYLRGVEADSISVVSAFHVVEHIAFETLRELVNEAHRILRPGGLLILETPNSENLMVGTSSFYLDPTHQRPLPAQLLSFVVEYSGFDRVKTLYLQDSLGLATAQQTTLVNVLGGVSPDYSIVAQKKTTKTNCALFDTPFEHSYGLRLDTLAERYDQETRSHTLWLQSEWDMAKQRIEELSKNAGKLETHSEWLQQEWDATKSENAQLRAHSEWLQQEWDATKSENAQLRVHSEWLQQEWDATNVKINLLEQELNSFYGSRSWRITKPLRLLSLLVKKTILISPGFLIKYPFKLILSGIIHFIIKRPRLKSKAMAVLKKYPRLYAHLRQFVKVRNYVRKTTAFVPNVKVTEHTLRKIPVDELLSRIRIEIAQAEKGEKK